MTGSTAVQLLDVKACKPPKCYMDGEQDVVDWVLAPLTTAQRRSFQQIAELPGEHGKTLHKSLDCRLMDVAGDIAYGS